MSSEDQNPSDQTSEFENKEAESQNLVENAQTNQIDPTMVSLPEPQHQQEQIIAEPIQTEHKPSENTDTELKNQVVDFQVPENLIEQPKETENEVNLVEVHSQVLSEALTAIQPEIEAQQAPSLQNIPMEQQNIEEHAQPQINTEQQAQQTILEKNDFQVEHNLALNEQQTNNNTTEQAVVDLNELDVPTASINSETSDTLAKPGIEMSHEVNINDSVFLKDDEEDPDDHDDSVDHNEKIDDMPESTDAVAAVVAAVEQAQASKDSLPASSQTAPARATKKKSTKSTNSTSSLNLNNSANDTPSPSHGSKRRKKDPYAPKAPLNGYLVYFNEERADMRMKNPNIGFGELTKIIAAKWKELPTEEKQKYINEADIDKERYVKEMADYKSSDAYKQYLKENSHAKMAKTSESNDKLSENGHLSRSNSIQNGNPTSGHLTPNLASLQTESNIAGFDIPIFTEEFIEHSKSREQESRQLRKEITELEQQNNVLNKHIENMKQSTAKIENEIEAQKNKNSQLQNSIDIFRKAILQCFNNTPLPNTHEYPTPANVDEYIVRMYSLINQPNQMDMNSQNFVMHAKSMIAKLNFHTLFESV